MAGYVHLWISIFSSRQKRRRVKELLEAESKEVLLASRISESMAVRKCPIDEMPSTSGWNLEALQVLDSGNKDPLLETSSEASNNENSFMETSSEASVENCFSSASSNACDVLSSENSDSEEHLNIVFLNGLVSV